MRASLASAAPRCQARKHSAPLGQLKPDPQHSPPFAADQRQLTSVNACPYCLPVTFPQDLGLLGTMRLAGASICMPQEKPLSKNSSDSATAAISGRFSVGPKRTIELFGGLFGLGWVGPIAEATQRIESSASRQRQGTSAFFPVAALQIYSRGWTGNEFAWKPVKSVIRRHYTGSATVLKTGTGRLVIPSNNSVYRVGVNGLDTVRADEITAGDRLAGDNASHWLADKAENPIDVVAIAGSMLPKAQVSVDLAGITRHDIGVTAWQWHNFHCEAKYGPRLPVGLYREHAGILPPPAWVYVHASAARRCRPKILLSDWAYVLGFFLGDGWVSETRVCFAVEKPRAEAFTAIVRDLPGADIDPTVRPMRGESVEVRFGNPVVSAVLRHVLGDRKCYEKGIPGEWITSWPEPARRELLRGMIDSDGNVAGRDGRRCYVTTSERLAHSLLVLLRSLEIEGYIHERQPTTGGKVDGRVIIGRRVVYAVHWSGRAENRASLDDYEQRQRFAWGRNRLREVRVRETECSEEAQMVTCELVMEGHPSFVCNGVLVRNSAS